MVRLGMALKGNARDGFVKDSAEPNQRTRLRWKAAALTSACPSLGSCA